MWIEVFEKTERDAQELLNRLEYMYLNIKSHKEKGTPYDQKIIKYLNAWGLDKQDSPDFYLSNTNKIREYVLFCLDKMRESLGNKNPDSSLFRAISLGSLLKYFEEVMHLWWTGHEMPVKTDDYLFEMVGQLYLSRRKIAENKSLFTSIDVYEQSLFNELSKNNPWSKHAS